MAPEESLELDDEVDMLGIKAHIKRVPGGLTPEMAHAARFSISTHSLV